MTFSFSVIFSVLAFFALALSSTDAIVENRGFRDEIGIPPMQPAMMQGRVELHQLTDEQKTALHALPKLKVSLTTHLDPLKLTEPLPVKLKVSTVTQLVSPSTQTRIPPSPPAPTRR